MNQVYLTHMRAPLRFFAFTVIVNIALMAFIVLSQDYFLSKLIIFVQCNLLIAGLIAANNGSHLGFANPYNIFAIGYIQYYILPPVSQIIFGNSLFLQTVMYGKITPQQESLLAYPIFCSLIGLIFFLMGYFSPVWRCLEKNRLLSFGRSWSTASAAKVIIFCFLLFVVASAAFFYEVGFEAYTNTPRSLRHFLYAQAPVVGFLVDYSGTVIVLLSVLVIEHYRRSKGKIKPLFIILFLFVPYVWFHLGLFSGSRIEIVRPALILLIYWHLRVNRLAGKKLLFYGILLFSFIVVSGVIRAGLGQENVDLASAFSQMLGSWRGFYTVFIYALDFPTTYDIFTMMADHIPNYDYGYGVTYLKLLFAVIPRTLWPDKPENITWISTLIFRPDQVQAGVSYNPSMLGEMYYNFGLMGIIAGTFVVGVIYRMIWSYISINGLRVGTSLVYAILLTAILEQFRGAFSNITMFYINFYIIPLFLISILANGKTRYLSKRD